MGKIRSDLNIQYRKIVKLRNTRLMQYYYAVFKIMKISNVRSCYMLDEQSTITLRCMQESSLRGKPQRGQELHMNSGTMHNIFAYFKLSVLFCYSCNFKKNPQMSQVKL